MFAFSASVLSQSGGYVKRLEICFGVLSPFLYMQISLLSLYIALFCSSTFLFFPLCDFSSAPKGKKINLKGEKKNENSKRHYG